MQRKAVVYDAPSVSPAGAKTAGKPLDCRIGVIVDLNCWPFLSGVDPANSGTGRGGLNTKQGDHVVLLHDGGPHFDIIEIGAGWSTLVSLDAIARNRDEDPDYTCELTSIEPYPRDFLHDLGDDHRLVNALVQDVPLDVFAQLEAGDILFVDSSHVVKIGSDAQYEFLEVIPRVAPGVLVQVHDIFFPTDYPPIFVKQWQRFFNEQYVLQAFLSYNSAFEVRWCGSWMAHHHPDLLAEAFPSFGRGGMWPSSFWMERIS